MQWLRELSAEQTSPIDMLIFIFFCVLICLVVAALIYAGLMMVSWRFRLRRQGVRLRRVFLPSKEHFIEYLGEYLLATTTALLLTITLVVKHDLVEQIKNFKNVSTMEVKTLAQLFPLQTIPDGVDKLTASQLLEPILEAGLNQEVKTFIKAIIESEGLQAQSKLTNVLLIACGLLILIYVLWLAYQRSHQLEQDPTGAPLDYGKIVRSLAVLATCIALLLLQATLMHDNDSLAESALAAIRVAEPGANSTHRQAIINAIDEQRREHSTQGRQLDAKIDEFTRELSTQDRELHAEIDELNRELSNRDRELDAKIDELTTKLTTQDRELHAEIDELTTKLSDLAPRYEKDISELRENHTTDNDQKEIEPNDTYAQAMKIPMGRFTGILTDDDNDYYTFDVPHGHSLELSFTPAKEGVDMVLLLLNRKRENVWNSEWVAPGVTELTRMMMNRSSGGTYYIRIYGNGQGHYQFEVSTQSQDDAGFKNDAGDKITQALPIEPGQSVSGELGGFDMEDWYKFAPSEGERIIFTPSDEGADMGLLLLNGERRSVWNSEWVAPGVTKFFRIPEVTMSPYFIKVYNSNRLLSGRYRFEIK